MQLQSSNICNYIISLVSFPRRGLFWPLRPNGPELGVIFWWPNVWDNRPGARSTPQDFSYLTSLLFPIWRTIKLSLLLIFLNDHMCKSASKVLYMTINTLNLDCREHSGPSLHAACIKEIWLIMLSLKLYWDLAILYLTKENFHYSKILFILKLYLRYQIEALCSKS